MRLIETRTVTTSGVTGIDFFSIPQNFTDLQVSISMRRAENNAPFTVDNFYMLFNDTSTGYSSRYLYAEGNGAYSDIATAPAIGYIPTGDSTANTFNSGNAYIPNYSGSNLKSFSSEVVSENNANETRRSINAVFWNNTSAINQLRVSVFSGTLSIGSTVSLYGITRGSGGATVS
jgi:hypothetical protein